MNINTPPPAFPGEGPPTALRATERRCLALIRRKGALPKAELARLAGLSPAAVAPIVGRLEQGGLLMKEDAQRGRVGQPSIPFALNPDGAFFFGLKIGRRSAELALMDFCCARRDSEELPYPFPETGGVTAFAAEAAERIRGRLPPALRRRIIGLGVAMPYELWSWPEAVGAPPGALDAWRDFPTAARIAEAIGLPAFLANDATAACAAELMTGAGRGAADFFYLSIGWFAGGGVALGGALYPGRRDNAGAAGSMPVTGGAGGGPRQLLRAASLYLLERRAAAAGLPFSIFQGDDWSALGAALDDWLEESAGALAQACAAAISVIDFQAVVIDGSLPPTVRARLVEKTRARFGALDLQGLSPIEIVEGAVGRGARAMGAACLPLLAQFGAETDIAGQEQAL